jgi:hypothetical protein
MSGPVTSRPMVADGSGPHRSSTPATAALNRVSTAVIEALSPICPAAHCPVPQLRIVQNAAADELLGHDPLALVIGMLLDQHVLLSRLLFG